MNDLASRLNAVMDAFPAKTALYCMDLTTGTPIAAIRENTRVVSASTIKVSILCCALQDVMDGKLSLDQPLAIAPGDFCSDTEVFRTRLPAGWRFSLGNAVLDDRFQRQYRH